MSHYKYVSTADSGAMGDFESFEGKQGRIANVSIPLFMVSSITSNKFVFSSTIT